MKLNLCFLSVFDIVLDVLVDVGVCLKFFYVLMIVCLFVNC